MSDIQITDSLSGNASVPTFNTVSLRLVVSDPDVVAELSKIDDDDDRCDFALSALRVGVLALRQARGEVDAQKIEREVDRLLGQLGSQLMEHSSRFQTELERALGSYFDPKTGQLPQRLERLVGRDGELQRVLADHVQGDTSAVAKTLSSHLGENSAIFKMLSPDQKNGVIAALTTSVEAALREQRDRVLSEFSLDRPDSALSRLVSELTEKNGELQKSLRTDLESVRSEFSLDNETGALARLVGRVEQVQDQVASQFSLDDAGSALSKMTGLLHDTQEQIKTRLTLDDKDSPLAVLKRELLDVVETVRKSQHEFQSELREAVATLKATREEAARSTRHGLTFEDAVGEFLTSDARRRNDVHDAVGATVGRIKNCKKGDHVITLGQDSAAAGARIVVEAKANKSYKLSDALEELDLARRNRDAGAGVFVYSSALAPQGIEAIERYGSDVVVVWDHEDTSTDARLRLAVAVARCLSIRRTESEAAESDIDFQVIDRAIEQIRKDIGALDEVGRLADTVVSNGQKISKRAELLRISVERQLEGLEAEYAKITGLHAREP